PPTHTLSLHDALPILPALPSHLVAGHHHGTDHGIGRGQADAVPGDLQGPPHEPIVIGRAAFGRVPHAQHLSRGESERRGRTTRSDRKSTRLNSSHVSI